MNALGGIFWKVKNIPHMDVRSNIYLSVSTFLALGLPVQAILTTFISVQCYSIIGSMGIYKKLFEQAVAELCQAQIQFKID